MKNIDIELFDDLQPRVPERSRLYRLPRISRDSGLIESLTSYIARLAAAHCLPLWVLVVREIAPLFKRKSIVNSRQGHCDLVGRFGAAINGNNATAIEAANAVELLTCQTDLRNLTMLVAGEYLAQTPLLRPIQAWCPHCLTEWSERKQELYYPLLWTLVAVQICPIHKTPLVEKCGKCQRLHYPLARRLRIGHCPHCQSWLGSTPYCDDEIHNSSLPATSWQLFAAESATGLVAALTTASDSKNPRAYFTTNLSQILENSFGGSKSAFAKYVGVHHASIRDWLAGKQKPSFKAVLLLAYRCEISPSELLLSDLRELKAVPFRPAHVGDDAYLRPQLRLIAPGKIEQLLRAALKNPDWPPLSLRAICRKAGFHQTQATNRFPDLTRQVSELYRSYRSEKRRQKELFTKMLVRSAVYEVCWAGQYPSQRKVRSKLPAIICLREPMAEAERLAVIRELGLNVYSKKPLTPSDKA